MNKKMASNFLLPFFFVFFLICPFVSKSAELPPNLKRYEFSGYYMGTQFNLIFYDSDSVHAFFAANKAFLHIKELDSLLSDYKEESELNYVSSTGGSGNYVPVSDHLWTILIFANKISKKTDGAFDITVGPLVKLWRRARRQYKLPSEEHIKKAKQSVGYKNLKFKYSEKKVMLKKEGMQLDLGGIAKGYTSDRVLQLLSDLGIKRALVDAGGDITLGDPPPDSLGWKVELQIFKDNSENNVIHLSNVAIATSGDLYQHLEIDNKRYSHIIDPVTGIGLEDQSKVTVIAKTGLTADATASAVSVLGPIKGFKVLRKFRGSAACISRNKNGQIRFFYNKKMKKILSSSSVSTDN